MDSTEASKLIASDLRTIARRDLDQFINVLDTGKVGAIENPFTGTATTPPIQEKAVAIREKLDAAGLLADAEFMTAFKQTVASLVETPVFSIAAAFDGAGEFRSGKHWGFSLDGASIETGMVHEFYFQ